jgi:V/A-type H+-transporting ATPase subunit E
MGLEKVIERIEKEGDEKIRSILQNAETQAEELLQKTQQNLEAIFLKRRVDTKKQIEAWRIQEKSGVDIEAKKIRLAAEKDILHRAYQECLTSLQSLPQQPLLTALIKNATHELPEAAFIFSNKRDEALVRSLCHLTYAGTIESNGGVVVENKDHTLRLDYTYETIAAHVWDDNLKEIAHILFR